MIFRTEFDEDLITRIVIIQNSVRRFRLTLIDQKHKMKSAGMWRQTEEFVESVTGLIEDLDKAMSSLLFIEDNQKTVAALTEQAYRDECIRDPLTEGETNG